MCRSLICACGHHLRVYSVRTGELLHDLPSPHSRASVAAVATNPHNPFQVCRESPIPHCGLLHCALYFTISLLFQASLAFISLLCRLTLSPSHHYFSAFVFNLYSFADNRCAHRWHSEHLGSSRRRAHSGLLFFHHRLLEKARIYQKNLGFIHIPISSITSTLVI